MYHRSIIKDKIIVSNDEGKRVSYRCKYKVQNKKVAKYFGAVRTRRATLSAHCKSDYPVDFLLRQFEGK